MQQDLLVPELTVYELLSMAASLQLKNLPKEERERRVEEAIEFLSLKDLRNRRIGRLEENLLSGGQRRRITLAIEGILSHHKILYLDEPTTGLSANDANQLIDLLQRLAKERQTTILLSIHQPRANVFLNYVDKLLLLDRGRTVFFGSPKNIRNFFADTGFPLTVQDYSNPADLMMDRISNSKIASTLVTYWNDNSSKYVNENNEINAEIKIEDDLVSENPFLKFLHNIKITFRNSIIETLLLYQFGYRIMKRRKKVFLYGIFIEMGYSIFRGLIFSELKDETAYISDRFSSVFRSVDTGSTGFAWLELYVELIPLSDRDLLVSRYGPVSFCIMWVTMTLIRSIFLSIANLIVYYWIAGLLPIFTHFLLFLVISTFYKTTQFSLLVFFAAITGSSAAAASLMMILEATLFINSGFYVPRDIIFTPLRWVMTTSMYYYAYEALSWIDISQRTFKCVPAPQEFVYCTENVSGEEFLTIRGFKEQLSLDYSVVCLWAVFPLCLFCFYNIFRVYSMQRRSRSLYSNNDRKIPQINNHEERKKIETNDTIKNDKKSLHRNVDDVEYDSEDEDFELNLLANNDVETNGFNEQKNILNSNFMNELVDDQNIELKEANLIIPVSLESVLQPAQKIRQNQLMQLFSNFFSNSDDGGEDGCAQKHFLESYDYHIINIRFVVSAKRFLFFTRNSAILLHNITATFEKGSITAILGPSGSGKSTLLQSISGFMHTSSCRKLYGDIYIDNHRIKSPDWPLNIVSFMGQFADLYLYTGLTIKQTLKFIAELQLPSSITYQQKKLFIRILLTTLRLEKVQSNIIGPIYQRSISGGQLRRLSLASDILLRRSKIIILDEPTSGLSASGAAEIISLLFNLAYLLKYTVILSIHQPRTEILYSFDNIMVLSKGRVVYYGNPKRISEYFASLGKPLPINENIADSLMDIVVQDEEIVGNKTEINTVNNNGEEIELVFNEEERLLVKSFVPPPPPHIEIENKERIKQLREELKKGWVPSGIKQICMLVDRRFEIICNFLVFSLHFHIFSIFVALVISLFLFRIDNTAENVQYLIAACLVVSNFWLFLNTFSLFADVSLKPIITFEFSYRRYQTFFGYAIHLLFVLIESSISAIIYTTISFWMIGFDDRFFSFVLVGLSTILAAWTIIAYQYAIVWFFKRIDTMTIITTITFYSFGTDMSGFICHINHIPVYMRWMTYLSFQRYLVEMSMFAFLRDREFPCDGEPSYVIPLCPAPGIDFLGVYGYSTDPYLRDILITLGATLIFFIVGFISYNNNFFHWRICKSRKQSRHVQRDIN